MIKIKNLIVSSFILVFCALCFSCTSSSGEKAGDASAKQSVSQEAPAKDGSEKVADAVSSATAKPNEVLFNGTMISAPQNYATLTLIMGGSVRKAELLSGQYVRKGQLLATLQNPEFVVLQQNFLEYTAQAEFLKAEYERQLALSKGEASSKKNLQQAKADYLSVESKKQAAEAQLKILQIEPETILKNGISPYLEIKAPISGYVGNVQINTGKYIASGEALCTLIDKQNILLKLVTYEKDLQLVHVGDPVEFKVNSMGENIFKARIVSIGQEVDPVSRSLEVYAKVSNSNPDFRPGMYVSARIVKP